MMRYLVFLLFLVLGCRAHQGSKLLSEVETYRPRVNTNFDWYGKDDNGKISFTRELKFCFDKQLSPVFREAITRTVAKLNQAQTGWTFVNDSSDGVCDSQWKLLARVPNLQPHLRIRQSASMDVPDPVKAGANVRIGKYEPSVTPVSDNKAQDKLMNYSRTSAATFNYERLFDHRFILAAEIVFNSNPAIKWTGGLESKDSVDADIVSMNVIAQAARLGEFWFENTDIQILDCGNQYAAEQDGSAALGISPASGQPLLSKALGDDMLSDRGIDVGTDGILHSHKVRSVMFPIVYVGNHCLNPRGSASNKDERVHFAEIDLQSLKDSAK
jgi:hypothetical protein